MKDLFLPILAGLAAFATTAAVADGDPMIGEALFTGYCATCHGTQGAGDGPFAEVLAIPVPDLSGLAARAGGEIDLARTVAIIQGDAVLRGHGGAMPVFGQISGGASVLLETADGAPLTTSATVADLIAYLETIQR